MTTSVAGRLKYEGEYDDGRYWERVNRNLAWMGETMEEARANQTRLRDATIGIAGTGGIGGATAIRLIRMGARHLKIADPEVFELSNVQRQAGATLTNLGRNKAEVVGEVAFETTGDAVIEVFPEGLNSESAEEFVAGCDIVTDQIEIYEIDAKYALHRAFRESKQARALYAVATVGHGALVQKYTPDSTPIEDLYGIPEGAEMNADHAAKLIDGQVPAEMLPAWPPREARRRWSVDQQIAPIFGPTPALCEGVLVWLICSELMDLRGAVEIPPRPGYAFLDMFSWGGKIVDEAGVERAATGLAPGAGIPKMGIPVSPL